jgi:hypothetical protein
MPEGRPATGAGQAASASLAYGAPNIRRLVGLCSCQRGMKLLGYRRPSLRNLSGYTWVKRQTKRQLGIVQAWTKPSRVKQRAKQDVGFCSPAMRMVRNTAKGRFPSFLGMFRKK